MPSCGGCQGTWTGTAKAHCSGCHRTFSGISAFDAHRVRSSCADPSTRDLIEVDGIWRSSESFDPTSIGRVSAGNGS